MKIGDIVSVPLYIGVSHNKPVYRPAVIKQAFDKGHLGVMYLCETVVSHFRTCIVVPPPPRLQPHPSDNKDIQRWSTETHYNSLEVEPEPTPRKPKVYRDEHLRQMYAPLLEHLGLDPTKQRSKSQLRSLAHFRGYNIEEIERGIYRWR